MDDTTIHNMRRCKQCNNMFNIVNFPITGKGYIAHFCKACIAKYKTQWVNAKYPRHDQQCILCNRVFQTRIGTMCRNCHSRTKSRGTVVKINNCLRCGRSFSSTTAKKKYCSQLCYRRTWFDNNIELKRTLSRTADYKRYHSNIQYRLQHILRSRFKSALKNNAKSGSAVKDLGCSILILKSYLESKFLPGMTWDNYGFYGWHIDHIIPISSVDLTNTEQLKMVCHYTNLQPLWAKENRSKSNKCSIVD